MSNWVKVASEADIPDGGAKQVEVGGEPVALFNVAGRIVAVHNTCLHRGGPLAEGELNGDIVTCPWHGWQWDVTTGKSPTNPSAKLRRYGVKVEAGEVYVSLAPISS